METNVSNKLKNSLSASKIKVYESCSFLYWAKYHLKLPDVQNLGSAKGGTVHSIFELLLAPKHKHIYDLIIKNNNPRSVKVIDRLIKIYIKKNGYPPEEETLEHISQMILVGLKTDFFIKDAKLIGSEYRFDIKDEEVGYYLKGFIDQIFEKDGELIISDWKSSKKKFEGTDSESNIQSACYLLAAKKLWPDKKARARFIFLQFPEDPLINISLSDETLKGVEGYLAFIQKKLDNFTIKDATKNLAADKGFPTDGSFSGKLQCGFAKEKGQLKKDGSPMFFCSSKFGFDYYAIIKDGALKYTVFTEDKNNVKLKEGEVMELKHYMGCPSFNRIPIEIPELEKKKYIKSSLMEEFGF